MLFNNFHLNGRALAFHLLTQKLLPNCVKNVTFTGDIFRNYSLAQPLTTLYISAKEHDTRGKNCP